MKCRLIYVNGVLDHILFNGKRDRLYDDFLKLTRDPDKALKMYANHEGRRQAKMTSNTPIQEVSGQLELFPEEGREDTVKTSQTRLKSSEVNIAEVREYNAKLDLLEAGETVEGIEEYRESLNLPIGVKVSIQLDTKPTLKSKTVGNIKSIAIFTKGERIGGLRINSSSGVDVVERTVIAEEFRGQGLGSYLYKKVVDKYFNDGKRLVSDITLNEGTRKIWEGLVAKGKAERIYGGRFQTIVTEDTAIEDTLADIQKSDESLTDEEKIDVRNLMFVLGVNTTAELKSILSKITHNGVMDFSSESLEQIFDKYVAENIIANKDVQEAILKMYNRLDSTDIEDIEYSKVFAKSFLKANRYGTKEATDPIAEEKRITDILANINPDEKVIDILPEEYVPDYLNNPEFKEWADNVAKTAVKAEVKEIQDGEVVPKQEFSLEELRNKIGTETPRGVEITLDRARRGIGTFQNIKEALRRYFEAIGLIFKNFQERINDWLAIDEALELASDVKEYINTQNNETLTRIQDLSRALFSEGNVITETVNISEELKGRQPILIRIESSTIPEIDMMRRFGYIKVADNLYVEVERDSVDEIISLAHQDSSVNPRNLPLDEFYEDMKELAFGMGLTSWSVEDTVANYLYKRYLGIETNPKEVLKTVSDVPVIIEDYGYITTEFVKDFNQYLIQEGNTDFIITDKGIELANGSTMVNEEALGKLPEGVRDDFQLYSIASRHLESPYQYVDNEIEDIDETEQERLRVYNNPNSIPRNTKPTIQVGIDLLAVKNTAETFIKQDGKIYERIGEVGNLSFFEKGPEVNPNFFQYNVAPVFSEIDLTEYTALANKAFGAEIKNIKLSQEVKDNYNC